MKPLAYFIPAANGHDAGLVISPLVAQHIAARRKVQPVPLVRVGEVEPITSAARVLLEAVREGRMVDEAAALLQDALSGST